METDPEVEQIGERSAIERPATGLLALFHALELLRLPVEKMHVTQLGIYDAGQISRYVVDRMAYYMCVHPSKTEMKSVINTDAAVGHRIHLEAGSPATADYLKHGKRAHVVLAPNVLSAYSTKEITSTLDRVATGTRPGGIFYATLDETLTGGGEVFWRKDGQYDPDGTLDAFGPFYELVHEHHHSSPAERVTIALRKLGGTAYEYLQEPAPRSYRVV